MKLVSHSRLRLILILLVADGLLFSLTNPSNVPSFMLVVGFLSFAVTVYYLMFGLTVVASWYGFSVNRYRRRFARTATGLIIGLAALQSIGELSLRDVIVLLLLAVLTYLYVSYGGQISKKASV